MKTIREPTTTGINHQPEDDAFTSTYLTEVNTNCCTCVMAGPWFLLALSGIWRFRLMLGLYYEVFFRVAY